MRLQWIKCPSVRREGKWFYTVAVESIRYSVLQNWQSSLWEVQVNHQPDSYFGTFATAKAAMLAVEDSMAIEKAGAR